MDVVSWKNGRGQEFQFVHFLDEGTLFHQGQPCQRDTEDQLQALENSWISWAGPPATIVHGSSKGVFLKSFWKNSRNMASR